MSDKKVYNVAQIAEEIEIPRTTINEWLNRFPQYLEMEFRGKRKVYTENALAVIREIAALRDYGHSTADIERELSHKHPFQAEVDDTSEQQEPAPTETVTALSSQKQQHYPEELARLINGELTMLTNSVQQNLRDARRAAVRSLRWQLILTVLMVLFGGALLWFAVQLGERMRHQQQALMLSGEQLKVLRSDTAALTRELENREIKIAEQDKVLRDMSVMLDKNSRDYQKNIDLLERELKSMQENFEADLKRESGSSAERQQAEMARLREEFAGRQLELLKKIEEFAKLKDQELARQTQAAAKLAAESATAAAQKTSRDNMTAVIKAIESATTAAAVAAEAKPEPTPEPEQKPEPEPTPVSEVNDEQP